MSDFVDLDLDEALVVDMIDTVRADTELSEQGAETAIRNIIKRIGSPLAISEDRFDSIVTEAQLELIGECTPVWVVMSGLQLKVYVREEMALYLDTARSIYYWARWPANSAFVIVATADDIRIAHELKHGLALSDDDDIDIWMLPEWVRDLVDGLGVGDDEYDRLIGKALTSKKRGAWKERTQLV